MSKNTRPATEERFACAITGRSRPRHDLTSLETVLPSLADRIRKDHPGIAHDALLSKEALAAYRAGYVEQLMKDESREFSAIERRVAESLASQATIASNVDRAYQEVRTLGEKMSDQLASFGGSWGFISGFGVALALWILLNVWVGGDKAFDPFPFILLNLILSCLAAIQAPIIMMSQKRQEAKDRLRSLNDYQVNLKAELEIQHLHEKIDHLINKQWQRLAEIQKLQLDIMNERRT